MDRHAARRALPSLSALALHLSLYSCSNESPPVVSPDPSPPERTAGWSLLNTSTELTGICELDGNIVVLSDGGAVVRGEGRTWRGDYVRSSGQNDIWSSKDGCAVSVGGGTVMKFDGNEWTWEEPRLDVDLQAVWGAACDDVYAVGQITNYRDYWLLYPVAIVHYNGREWKMAGPDFPNDPPGLSSIWGTGSDNIFTVGTGGAIFRFDGHQWLAMESNTNESLTSVWGRAANDVFATGHEGVILHYDGAAWTSMDSPTASALLAISGAPDGTVLAVGEEGTILRLEGSTWSALPSNTSLKLNSVIVRSATDAYVGGALGTIHHYDGSEWKRVWGGVRGSWLRGVWASSPHDIFGVGEYGRIIHFDGNEWTDMDSGTEEHLYDAWGSSSHDVFAAGTGGTILHFDGVEWAPMNEDISVSLFELFGFSRDEVYATTDDGRFFMYDGVEWNEGDTVGATYVAGMWGTSGSNLFAAGDSGFVARFDGSKWTQMDSGTTHHLGAIWGRSASDVTAFSRDVIHYDGVTWSVIATEYAYYQSAFGVSPNQILASSEDIVYSLSGATLAVSRAVSPRIEDMWGTSNGDVFGVGYNGMVIRYSKSP